MLTECCFQPDRQTDTPINLRISTNILANSGFAHCILGKLTEKQQTALTVLKKIEFGAESFGEIEGTGENVAILTC